MIKHLGHQVSAGRRVIRWQGRQSLIDIEPRLGGGASVSTYSIETKRNTL
jgi:hypothetical protein